MKLSTLLLCSSLLSAVFVSVPLTASSSTDVEITPATNFTEAQIQARLDAMFVEDFTMDRVPISQAIDHLDSVVAPFGLQIIFKESPDNDPVVNLRTRDLSMANNLSYLCKQAGYSWSVQSGVIIVAAPGTFEGLNEPLITDILPIRSTQVRRLTRTIAD